MDKNKTEVPASAEVISEDVLRKINETHLMAAQTLKHARATNARVLFLTGAVVLIAYKIGGANGVS